MKELQTVGREFHKGFSTQVFYTDETEIVKTTEKNLFQVLFIDEGSVIISSDAAEKALLTPVLLCLNYAESQDKITITNSKGFSLFFRPEAINHGLLDTEDGVSNAKKNYLATEQLLVYPFQESNKNNPVCLPVNGIIRERLLRMAENIDKQFLQQPDDYWPCRGRSFVLEMLMLLQSLYKLENNRSMTINTTNEAVSPLLRTIHSNYSDSSFDAKTPPEYRGLKRFIFLRKFKNVVGKSPVTYLRELRCAVAENLLKNTMLQVAEIARRCGYNTEKKFSSDFFALEKMTPAAWRSQFPNPYG